MRGPAIGELAANLSMGMDLWLKLNDYNPSRAINKSTEAW
jgi:hypothetical protein